MYKTLKLLMLITLITASSCKKDILETLGHQESESANVILLTLDGVRYEEFFNKEVFKTYWREYANKGIVLGDPSKHSKVRVATPTVLSLPAYKTIHTGKKTTCISNNCKFGKTETLSEKILRTKNFDPHKVALISSWFPICYAAMRKLSNVFNSCGISPINLEGHERLNALQEQDKPIWKAARKDIYTFEQSLKFIENQNPRFLHIGLNDADEWGHDKEWDNYINTLKSYDSYIDRLHSLLQRLGDYGQNTTVIITTDHGRGRKAWNTHPFNWHARKIWMSISGPGIPESGSISHSRKVNHLHIRPFIETILKVK